MSKKFKGVIHAGFENEPKGPSIGLEWFSTRCRASFQPGMQIVPDSYLKHDKRGKGRIDICVIGNDGRTVICTIEMRIVSGVFINADKGRRMIIRDVEN